MPESITWVSKVWEEITIPVYAKHKRYGSRAGRENPYFLNADLFIDKVLAPFEQAKVESRLAAFVFEFQTLGGDYLSSPYMFFDRLDSFFNKLPSQYNYAVEIRNPYFLVDDYFAVLNNHKVTHCFNHWTRMPGLKKQMIAASRAGGLDAPFYVARLLTPLNVRYADAVKRFEPYNVRQDVNFELAHDIVRLAKRACEKMIPVTILINNRLEGCAPITISCYTDLIVEARNREGD